MEDLKEAIAILDEVATILALRYETNFIGL